MKLVKTVIQRSTYSETTGRRRKLPDIEVVTMSGVEARRLVRELQPQLKGMCVGEFPLYEKLCKLTGIDSGFVN